MKKSRRKTLRRKSSSRGRKPTARPPASRRLILVLLLVAVVVMSCLAGFLGRDFFRPAKPRTQRFRVVQRFPHDPSAFTQGLVFDWGVLYESTGLEGKSSLRRVALETGMPLASRALDPEMFGEGLTLWKDQLIQLTWKNGVAFVYDKTTLSKTGEFRYEGDGWGLTHDGAHLIMSNGSSQLCFLDPQTFQTVKTLTVRDRGRAVPLLNELEFVRGEIYANVWKSDRIACISPKTGKVRAWIDLKSLLDADGRESGGADVLNGIAWDEEGGRLFVTGKLWPWLYQLELE